MGVNNTLSPILISNFMLTSTLIDIALPSGSCNSSFVICGMYDGCRIYQPV
jgi:hypothetical protein